ncbi:hypothetical protein U1701_13230 [Sphingomonas sp. PB2P19]|uniref:hypothetical protein n=1 Tax=Sphingomonas rhamnosi TaxID=3096156 RepID=UPI002FC91266
MVKDKRARQDNRITLMAVANMIAAMVDAMRFADVPNDVIRRFLDNFEELNCIMLDGPAYELMDHIVDVVRSTVPSND